MQLTALAWGIECCCSASHGSTCSWPCYLRPSQSSLAFNSLSNSVQSGTRDVLHTHQCPSYLSNIVVPLHSNPSRQRLRSSIGTDYLIPQTRTKLGERSFSVAGPTIWNFLPETVRAVSDKTAFKRVLKTHFFNIAFNSSQWHCNASSVRLAVNGALNTLFC